MAHTVRCSTINSRCLFMQTVCWYKVAVKWRTKYYQFSCKFWINFIPNSDRINVLSKLPLVLSWWLIAYLQFFHLQNTDTLENLCKTTRKIVENFHGNTACKAKIECVVIILWAMPKGSGLSRTFSETLIPCTYVYTQILSLNYLSDGLFNRLQWYENCLAGHQDIAPMRKIYCQDEKKINE